MSVRQWVNNNALLATGAAALVLVVGLGVLALQMRGPAIPRSDVYYWDVDTGEYFADTNQTPPITAPSGGDGVRAHLYSCGECSPEEWFGYLAKRTEEYHALRDEVSHGYGGMPPEEQEHFDYRTDVVRPVGNGGEWVPRVSPEGEVIRDRIREECNDNSRPIECLP